MGSVNCLEFGYFTRTNLFTKNHILSMFAEDESLLVFIPNKIDPKQLDRSLLLSVKDLKIFLITYLFADSLLREEGQVYVPL